MARNRKKIYEQGDRINIYLSRDLTPEFVNWINKQSDLSNFFLYAAQQLYQQTGFIDVSEVMPRKINYELSTEDKTPQIKTEAMPIVQTETNKPEINRDPINELESDILDKDKKTAWSNVENLDDPYA